jgi:hypothetical protein
VSRLRTLADVRKRAQRHAIRTTWIDTHAPSGQWLKEGLRLEPCPACGDATALAEDDGLGILLWCRRCTGDIEAALLAEPGPDTEDLVDLLLDLVLRLVLELGRREAAA